MKEKLSEKIDKFMNKMLGIPPTMEELSTNFPHKEGCAVAGPLKQFEREEVVNDGLSSGWVQGSFIKVTRKYLECGSCHIQARFSE